MWCCHLVHRLESPTRSLEMQASQEIFIQSRAGSIEATSLNDIKLRSISGSVSFTTSFPWLFSSFSSTCFFFDFSSLRFVLMLRILFCQTWRRRSHQIITRNLKLIISRCTKFIKFACVTTEKYFWHRRIVFVPATMSVFADNDQKSFIEMLYSRLYLWNLCLINLSLFITKNSENWKTF